VKDLKVEEAAKKQEPPRPQGVPNDPAILSVCPLPFYSPFFFLDEQLRIYESQNITVDISVAFLLIQFILSFGFVVEINLMDRRMLLLLHERNSHRFIHICTSSHIPLLLQATAITNTHRLLSVDQEDIGHLLRDPKDSINILLVFLKAFPLLLKAFVVQCPI